MGKLTKVQEVAIAMTRRLTLRDWEASAWHAGRLSAVVRLSKEQSDKWIAVDDAGNGEFVPVLADSSRPHGIHAPRAIRCPLGPRGHRLWIAESWSGRKGVSIHSYMSHLFYRADGHSQTGKQVGFTYMERESHWRSPATMPQWASRSTAVHLGSRLVRVQELAGSDDESVVRGAYDKGKAAWNRNDWCWLHRIGRE